MRNRTLEGQQSSKEVNPFYSTWYRAVSGEYREKKAFENAL